MNINLPTADELDAAMALIVAAGRNAPELMDLTRLGRMNRVLTANADRFVQLFEEMKQVTPALAQAVVTDALVRGLYIGLRIEQIRKGLADAGNESENVPSE